MSDEARFIGHLPQGTIELVGVTRSLPNNHSQWWQPDGSAATLGPYRPRKDDARWARRAPEKRISFLLHITCLPVDTSSTPKDPPPKQPANEQDESDISASDEPWPVPRGPIQQPGNERREIDVSWPAWGLNGAVPPSVRMWEGHSVLDPHGDIAPDYKIFSASLDPSARAADFGVGISTGSWATVITRKPDTADTSSFRRDGRQWFVKFHPATPGDPSNSTEVKIVLAGREFYGKLYTRLVAVANDGREYASLIGYRGNDGTAVFRGLLLASISELRFQVRPYDWVEFRNVSLRPGQKTDVKVVSFDDSVELAK